MPLLLSCSAEFGDEANIESAQSALSLTGSNFEIEDPDVGGGANLVVDGPVPDGGIGALDWANVNETRKNDLPSGQNDDSFGQGSKEDTEVPAVVSGSIPPNKSDLKTFGVYVEENNSGKFLNLFWTRVQDPSGTTNMDFEFNQSTVLSGNGITPVRTKGDPLVVYELSKGGTVPELFLFTWLDGTEGIPCEADNSFPCWGDRTDLTGSGTAIGSINTTAISAPNADGLGSLDARTFGEATIDTSVIFDPNKCQSFGSAYLKSRSSDSFPAALKDYIAPVPVNISNCGKVIIRKETEPDGDTTSFGYTTNLQTDPSSSSTFSLTDGQSKTFTNALFGTGYTVVEDDPSSDGFDLKSIDCSASSGVTPTISLMDRKVTFDIDDATDVVDCTYTNRARGTIIVEKQTIPDGAAGTFSFSGDATGVIGDGGTITKMDLAPGTYTSTEADPTPGFDLTSISCNDTNSGGSLLTRTATFQLEAGETIKCTFTNTQRGAIRINKTAKNASLGAGLWPQAGVSFAIRLGMTLIDTKVTDMNGQACIEGLIPGMDYTVTETVPMGYAVASGTLNPQTVTVTAGGSCSGTPDVVNFVNDPLSELQIKFLSLAGPGVTKATSVKCTGPSAVGTEKGPLEDTQSASFTNLVEGTYTCTIVVDP